MLISYVHEQKLFYHFFCTVFLSKTLHRINMPPLKVYFPQIPLTVKPFGNKVATKGTITFKTTPNQSKVEIRNYLEKVYGVGVLKVNTMNYQPRYKFHRIHQNKVQVKRKQFKKTIVTVDNTYYLDLLSQQDLKDLKKATDEAQE